MNCANSLPMGRRKNTDTVEVHSGLYLKRQDENAPWQCYFRLDGRQFRQSTKTRELAEAKLLALQWFNETRNKQTANMSIERMSFQKLSDLYLAHTEGLGKYPYHSETIKRHFLPFFGSCKDVSQLSTADVQDYFVFRRAKGSALPQTLNRENTVLRQIFSFAEKRGLLSRPIVIEHLNERLTRTRRSHFMIEEYIRLCHVAQARITEPDVRGKPLSPLVRQQRQLLFDYIKFMTNSGLRVDEARTLTWRNVELENRAVLVHHSGKTKKVRTAYVRHTGLLALRRILARRTAYLAEHNLGPLDPNERVFSLDNGTPVDSFKKGFNALLEAAGFVYINKRDKHAPYSLRHSYATYRLTTKRDKRASSKSLALQMGTSVRMIEKYYGHDEIHDYEDACVL